MNAPIEETPLQFASEPIEPEVVLTLTLRRVRLRAHRRLAWLTSLYGDDTNALSTPALAACLDNRDTLDSESSWLRSAPDVQPINDELSQVEEALDGPAGDRYRQLADMFGLRNGETDLLQAALALAVEPSLATVYAHLQRHPARGYCTDVLVSRLFGYGHPAVWNHGSALGVWQLIHEREPAPGEPVPLSIDPILVAWFHGDVQMDASLVGRVQWVIPQSPLVNWPVDKAVSRIESSLNSEQRPQRCVVVAPAGTGRRTFSATVASRFAIQSLAIDCSDVAPGEWTDFYIKAQRLAALGNTALIWHGTQAMQAWPRNVMPGPLQFVVCDLEQTPTPNDWISDHRYELPVLTHDERTAFWRSAVASSVDWEEHTLVQLSSRFRLGVGDIESVARKQPTSAKCAARYSRELTRHQLGELARLMDCPFRRDDLIVPDKLRDALDDLIFEAQHRAEFWEKSEAGRLYPRGRGLVAQFSGPPGTGKTMAAQIIAAELGLDLFRIDLAAVVSKYIGETAKNLGRIFAGAARMNAVLLFDEADAVLAKRTEVKDSHDRHANADTGYLLQLLEEYRGVAILATNKRQNIDPAFVRRVRYALDFPRPEAEQRRALWHQVIHSFSRERAGNQVDIAINHLATSIDVSGAQIKNAVLSAVFIARRRGAPLAMRDLLAGVEREIAKEGRVLSAADRAGLLRHA